MVWNNSGFLHIAYLNPGPLRYLAGSYLRCSLRPRNSEQILYTEFLIFVCSGLLGTRVHFVRKTYNAWHSLFRWMGNDALFFYIVGFMRLISFA
ncbi:hypothetical protein F5Y11DRAFT_210837 [Daldinia sp. FL1419]|nr:hypothetical protein F5Y11DRAFT_210837 [Daldinia sp. FL1419]